MSIAMLLSALAVLAAAPAVGVVVEGQSVPGIALGDTRAQVVAAYGEPQRCQDLDLGGDLALCVFPVEGGGTASVWYHGADGRYARNAPDDVAYRVRWFDPVSGWTTTAGVNTELAASDGQAVADAYPNAEATRDSRGNITRVEDPQLGIAVQWIQNFYGFPDSVSMEIYTPPPTLPEGSSTHIADIDVTVEKVKSRRHVIAVISVRGEQGQPVSGANVLATWTFPKANQWMVDDLTSSTGYAYFTLYDAANGDWTLTVDDVLLEGHSFDRESSVLSASFRVK